MADEMEGGDGASIMEQPRPEDASDRTGGCFFAPDDERPESSTRIRNSRTDASADRVLPPVGFDRQAASRDVPPPRSIGHA
jgi:hypothetical protein